MFYSVDGKIVEVGGAFPERKVNTLTFQVEGDRFPIRSAGNFGSFTINSEGPNSVVVNYGDGQQKVATFTYSGIANVYSFAYRTPENPDHYSNINSFALEPHIFQDNYTGVRNITFQFEDLSKIVGIIGQYIFLNGVFPTEIGYAKNLELIRLFYSYYILEIPNSISNISSLKAFDLGTVFPQPKLKIPDGIFNNTGLETLGLSGSFALTDPIASNFFKINQLKYYLTKLGMSRCQIEYLPTELKECTLISDLRMDNNSIKNPEVIETLINLKRLYLPIDPSVLELPDMENLNKLIVFLIASPISSNLINQIPQKWTGLKSLKSFLNLIYFISQETFDLFIDNFYTLCTTNGFLDPVSQTAIDTGFPNQFRDITWGDSSLAQKGTIQAPTGFILGSDNGTPANQGEKIYVLINNYGHNVTTSGNFN